MTGPTDGAGRLGAIEKASELALKIGLVSSTLLLLGGLAFDQPTALRIGVVLLMLTPVARVVVVSIGLVVERDWFFALISIFVLGVLGSGIWVAFRP